MKKKIHKILGIGLTLVLVVTFAIGVAAPVAAAEYEENDWGTWGLPAIEPDTDVGTMAVAPDGTLYAAVFDDDEGVWKVMKSEDNGYTWDDTELDDAGAPIVQIVVSPNYEEDEILYVGCADATVYRLEEAGEGDVTALKEITDTFGTDASELFSMDVWTDEDDYNWILVATDLDVLVLKDKTFEDWRDQELASGGNTWVAYEVAFAPDFEDSDLLWAVIEEFPNATGNDFLVTSTVSPGQWGQEIGDVVIPVTATQFLDVGFPDDYDSDPDTGNTIMYVGLSTPIGLPGGDVYLIEGVEAPDDSNAIALFALAGDLPAYTATFDIVSIAVSGDYGDEVFLAGELRNPVIWISDDGGDSWDEVDKQPTGEGPTYVCMEADVVWTDAVFDTEEGMAFASTFGNESAVSRTNDGGQVNNQVGLIDTEIDGIWDLAFHPDFPDESTFLMITEDTSRPSTYSLWLTENGDEEEPDYIRVLCGFDADPPAPGNFSAEELRLVAFSQDADAIYIHGVDDGDASSIWKSTDDGQTFGKRRSVEDDAQINDWVIPEDDTIYAAASDDGFYLTTNSGLSWSSTNVGDMNSIALSPDFEEDETILLGGDGGEVFMSDDEGDSFDDTEVALTGAVFVAFDADYADEDADGEFLIYACGDDDNIQVGEVADTDDVDWDDLYQDEGTDVPSGEIDCGGLVVAEDNALYAIAWDTGSVWRLLLHEDDSEWEDADGLVAPMGLWLTPGSNVLWTIDGDELWVLEDTCSGQVELDSPPDDFRHDREDVIQLAWDEVRGADEYEYFAEEATGIAPDIDGQTDDLDIVVRTEGSAEYEWKVRVALDEPWHSRWSDTRTFYTALGAPPWAPTLYSPGGVYEYSGIDVVLMPGFIWESAKTADSYQFVLADNTGFISPLVDEILSQSAYQLDFELEYDSNYYWKVMAYKGEEAISRWSDIGVFTTEAEPTPEVWISPYTGEKFTSEAELLAHIAEWEAAHPPVTPAYIWVIIVIGAALVIAVLIMIVRTRRVA